MWLSLAYLIVWAISYTMSNHQTAEDSPGTQDVWLGHKRLQFPSPSLGQLEDHTGLLGAGDWTGLRDQLAKKGYLRLRGLLDRGQVLAARTGGLESTNSLIYLSVNLFSGAAACG